MIKISNITIKLTENGQEIIRDFSLEFNHGQVTLLTGRNGAGKSTIVNTIMGNPSFEISAGEIKLIEETYPIHVYDQIKQDIEDEEAEFHFELDEKHLKISSLDITKLSPTTKSHLGIFLANQYPVEIPGVGLSSFLRTIYNIHQPKEEQLPVFKFKKLLEEICEDLNYPTELLKRNLNEGFSGGEKKKTEILQMLILQPRYIFLDEIDSGLDKTSTKQVFETIARFKQKHPNSSITVITHYDHLESYLPIDKKVDIS